MTGYLLAPATSVDCTALVAPIRVAPDLPVPDRRDGRGRRRPRLSPEELARIAADRAIALAPQPRLAVAPSRVGLTGLESYFWLAERPTSIAATASAGGITVTAEARPVQYIWDFGDGNDRVTADPGRPWTRKRPGSIEHLYETRGNYSLSVEVIWEARWNVNGGPWQPLGFFSNSDSRRYPVRQVIAMLTR